MKGSIENRVKAVVAHYFSRSGAQVRLDDVFVDDLGADALDFVEILNAVEAEFGVVIPRTEADGLISVGSVVDWLRPGRNVIRSKPRRKCGGCLARRPSAA